jgi:hypothetical protein
MRASAGGVSAGERSFVTAGGAKAQINAKAAIATARLNMLLSQDEPWPWKDAKTRAGVKSSCAPEAESSVTISEP